MGGSEEFLRKDGLIFRDNLKEEDELLEGHVFRPFENALDPFLSALRRRGRQPRQHLPPQRQVDGERVVDDNACPHRTRYRNPFRGDDFDFVRVHQFPSFSAVSAQQNRSGERIAHAAKNFQTKIVAEKQKRLDDSKGCGVLYRRRDASPSEVDAPVFAPRQRDFLREVGRPFPRHRRERKI